MVESNILRKESDAAAGSSVTERLPQHASGTTGRTHEAHGEMDRRALTRTVGPQEPENFSGLDLQTETIQSTQPSSAGKAPIFFCKIFELEGGDHLHSF